MNVEKLPMDKEAAITTYLRQQYQPLAVVLHGSRAIGQQRRHSDWDVFLLHHEPPTRAFGREAVAGEDVEWQAITVPVADQALLKTCGVVLQFARVLWEDASCAGSTLLRQAAAFYARGVALTDADKAAYRQYLIHKAHGMEDDAGTPCMFLRHQQAFLERATNWWFEMRGDYKKPLYVAMPLIQANDPVYHDLLLQLAAPGANLDKVRIARLLISRLFG